MSRFLVWQPEMGETRDEAKPFLALTKEGAAQMWAEQYDRGNNSLTCGVIPTIAVARDFPGSHEQLFDVSATVTYHAKPIS